MALSGVRSSWLMLARNALLARLASSAASTAATSSSWIFLRFRDVHHGAERAGHRAALVAERGGGDLRPEGVAALLLDLQLVLFGQALQPQLHALAVGRELVLGDQQLLDRAAHHLVRRALGELGHPRVDVGDGVERVGDDQALAQRLDGDPEARLALAQGGFLELALGDVAQRDPGQRLARQLEGRGHQLDREHLAVGLAGQRLDRLRRPASPRAARRPRRAGPAGARSGRPRRKTKSEAVRGLRARISPPSARTVKMASEAARNIPSFASASRNDSLIRACRWPDHTASHGPKCIAFNLFHGSAGSLTATSGAA